MGDGCGRKLLGNENGRPLGRPFFTYAESKMIETFTEFDPAEYLSTPEAIAEFTRDTQETDDTSYIDKAMEVFARAKGMTELSRG